MLLAQCGQQSCKCSAHRQGPKSAMKQSKQDETSEGQRRKIYERSPMVSELDLLSFAFLLRFLCLFNASLDMVRAPFHSWQWHGRGHAVSRGPGPPNIRCLIFVALQDDSMARTVSVADTSYGCVKRVLLQRRCSGKVGQWPPCVEGQNRRHANHCSWCSAITNRTR